MNGDIQEANLMLGYNYRVSGSVVHGKELGRTIGFPTANIEPTDPRRLIPANGVYAVRIHLDETSYPAMVNIGHRPTVDSENAPETIEAHIIGFTGDLYGKTVEIEFLRFLREERRFSSLEALRRQLTLDAEAGSVLLSLTSQKTKYRTRAIRACPIFASPAVCHRLKVLHCSDIAAIILIIVKIMAIAIAHIGCFLLP